MSDDVKKGTVHLVHCFGELEEKLRELYSLDAEGLTEDIAERRRLHGGVLIVADFLKKTNLDEKIWGSFGNLAFGLSELDKGHTTSVLTPAKRGGGRLVDRSDVYMVRANVVQGLECLIHAGQEEKEAAQYIARNYPIFKRLLVGRKPMKKISGLKDDYLANPILSWRKSFLDGTVKEDGVQRAFTDSHPSSWIVSGSSAPRVARHTPAHCWTQRHSGRRRWLFPAQSANGVKSRRTN